MSVSWEFLLLGNVALYSNVNYLSICLRALLIPLLAIATLAWYQRQNNQKPKGRPVTAARCCFGELTCLNVQFGVLSSVASFPGGIIGARALPKLEPGWNRSRCDCFCDHRRAYLRLFVQLTLERHDFDKRSVVGMTDKRILKVTDSTLDRFHDESEYRLPIPPRYIVDSEGVTPGRGRQRRYRLWNCVCNCKRRTWPERARVTRVKL
jgi:hypothetical protein